jgi:nitrite reductase/ring-hydroxylating ferredoxin subunit
MPEFEASEPRPSPSQATPARADPAGALRFVSVARLDDLPENGAVSVEVGRRTIALFRCDGRLHALDDLCPHSGGPLSEGEVEGGRVTCPWHGARFALDGGASESPISGDVRCHPVREREGAIEVGLPEADLAPRPPRGPG